MSALYADYSDEELIGLLREGRRDITDYIMEKYKGMVKAKARSMFLLGGDSDDLIQEGMLGLMKAVREFNGSKEASFRTFAEVCIRNRVYSVLRAASREKHSPLNHSISIETPFFESNSYTAIDGHEAQENPEDLMIRRENRSHDLLRINQRLSPLERSVLSLYLDGLTFSEIAEVLGKPSKSVENAVQRIRRKAARS